MSIPSTQLAGRGQRFAARLIDGLIYSAPMMVVVPKFLSIAATTAQLQQAGMTEQEIAAQMDAAVVAGIMGTFLMAAGVIFIIMVVQFVFLSKDGQTIGKKAMSVRIVKFDTGKNGGFVTNVLLRTVLNFIICMVPFYKLVDILFIFREDKRCIHDLIAGTSVVKA